jgi:hypothetical protein
MTENRYKYGKIYKITSEHINKIYVGSTCKKLLSQRLAHHNSGYKRWNKCKSRYVTSYELFELGSVQITLLEAYPCNTKDELLSRERHYIELYKDIIINKVIPNRTNKEYIEDNKEKIKDYKKEYYKNNKNIISYEQSQPIICVCGSIITKSGKSRHEKTIKHNNFIKSEELPEIMPAPESG